MLADRFARVLLVAAPLAAATLFIPQAFDSFNLVKLSALAMLTLSALAINLWMAPHRIRWIARSEIMLTAGAFVALASLAAILSDERLTSVLGLYQRYGGLVSLLIYFGLASTVGLIYHDRPAQIREIAVAITVSSVLVATYILIQSAGLDWISWREQNGLAPSLPVGSMGNSNFAGAYLGMTVPIILSLALMENPRVWRTNLLMATALSLVALWFTQSRGGMLAAGAGLSILVFVSREMVPRWIKRATIAVIAGLVCLFAIFLIRLAGDSPGPVGGIQVLRTGSLQARLYYWSSAIEVVRHHPLLGTGPDTFFAQYPLHRMPEDGARNGLSQIADKPHNIVLETAAGTGLVGLTAFVGMFVLALARGLQEARGEPRENTLLAAGFSAALAGYLTQGLFSIDVPPLAALGWIMVGSLAALSRARSMDSLPVSGRGAPKPHSRQATRILAALLIVSAITIAWRPLAADLRAGKGDFDGAIRMNPLEPAYYSMSGRESELLARRSVTRVGMVGAFRRALERYEEAYEMQPGNLQNRLNLARSHTLWATYIDPAGFADADRWWRRTVATDRTNWELHNQYAGMLQDWARAKGGDKALKGRAVRELETVVRMRPAFVPAWVNLAALQAADGDRAQARRTLLQALHADPMNPAVNQMLADLRDP